MFIPRVKKIDTSLTRESAIICGLLHDLCKIGYYNNINGQWKSSKNHAANGLHGVLSVDTEYLGPVSIYENGSYLGIGRISFSWTNDGEKRKFPTENWTEV